jgi:Endosomal/lysosomal potassium channel TMEM175
MTGVLRESFAGTGVGRREGFRWRGGEITRLEGFSDAVFAFAITLLVVSLEVPRTFHELAATMRGFLAFGVCFALLIVLWHEHYVFFRRYGLQDAATVWLNAALLFVMLFYVYPLKFVFRLVLSGLTGAPTVVPLPGGGVEPVIEVAQMPTLFLIYGGGVIALYLLLALLYFHAYRLRRELALTPVEVFDTRASIVGHLLAAGVALVSVAVALLVPPRLVGLAGYTYFLFGPVMAAHGSIAGARRRRLHEEEVRA